ncbi:MAG TPA: hypothetical protein VGR56_03965 [Nitrososphaerales archaeon]|nr:hypothetical protein [Nitrososphaerales archaeon]
MGSNLTVYHWESVTIQWYASGGTFMQTVSFNISGIIAASYPSNYTASYSTNYEVTLKVSPPNGGTVSYSFGQIGPSGSTTTSTTVLFPAYSTNTPVLDIWETISNPAYVFGSCSSSTPYITLIAGSCSALIYAGGTITINFYPVSTTTTTSTSSNSSTISHTTITTMTTFSSTAGSTTTQSSQTSTTPPSSTTASTTTQSSQTSTTPGSVTIVASVHLYILNKTGCTHYVCSWFSNWVVASGNQAIWSDYSPVNTGNVSYTLSFSCLYYMQWYFPLSPPYPYTGLEFIIQAQNGTVYLDQGATAPNTVTGTWRPPCVNTPSMASVALPPAFEFALPAFMLIAAIISGLRETERDKVSDSQSHCLRKSWRAL